MRNRWLLVGLGVVVLAGLFFLLKPDSTEVTSTTNLPPEATTSAEPTSTSGSVEPTSTPSLDAIEIEVEEGQVEGPETITVAQGETVRLEVKTDVADEVHVHGYDLMFDTTPDEETPIEFEATIPGVFEIELEDAGVLLTRLEVTA